MRKIFKILSVAAPVILTAGSVGTYLAISTHKSHGYSDTREGNPNISGTKTKSEHTNDDYSKFHIFPKLDQHDFYNEIKINKLKAVIDEEMQAKVVNYVFRHMNFTEGNILYSIEKFTDQRIDFHFKWTSPDGYPHFKTYHFSIADTTK